MDTIHMMLWITPTLVCLPMPNPMNPLGFLLPLPRLFTRQERDAYDLIHFNEQEGHDDETSNALEAPENWNLEARTTFAQNACFNTAPSQVRAIEENTVPSWLWKHTGVGRKISAERKVQQVFDRLAGSSTYNGWKQNLFADEFEARHFFDEIRYALATRAIAIEPRFLSTLGIEWAYNITHKPSSEHSSRSSNSAISITNTMIDAVVSGNTDQKQCGPWHQALPTAKNSSVTLNFVDTAKEWELNAEEPIPVVLDIMAFRHNDGSINIDRLRHAVRLAVILLDLQDHVNSKSLAIGFCNLAPLLVAMALPYDSAAARMTAAALTAIISAQAYITSAQLANLRGVSLTYTTEHETILRALRNHRRAVYGDHTDYEKVSVLPQPLTLTPGLDLTLVASAQRLWDEVLENVRNFGLRHTQVTSTMHSTSMTSLMESFTEGIDPLRCLTVIHSENGEVFTQAPHPSLAEALTRLGYTPQQNKVILAHVAGHRSLTTAPAINHAALRSRGFDSAALNLIENYLPYINDVRLAFTPWILGEAFCLKTLKISVKQLKRPSFSLLQHIGFTPEDILAANNHYYGFGTVKNAKYLRSNHLSVFACENDLAPEAHIRMAAAVQGFVSGCVALSLHLPRAMAPERSESLVLSAWRQGIKTITIAYTDDAVSSLASHKEASSKEHPIQSRRSSSFLHTQKPALPVRHSKPKAGRRLVGLGTHRPKNPVHTKGKR